ncbi:MAG: hypothetical protein HQL72_05720 [Magnetococcales bacterium]|nr:hypothetical protein [Magnetococcales bacterium]
MLRAANHLQRIKRKKYFYFKGLMKPHGAFVLFMSGKNCHSWIGATIQPVIFFFFWG